MKEKTILAALIATVLLLCTFFAGRAGSGSAVITIERQLSDWDILKLAIIKTECEFDSLAVGRTQDVGIFQITPVYVEELNRLLGEEIYTHEDAFNPVKSMEMFEVYQKFKNPEHDIDRAIRLHNPGGESIGYGVRVRQNMAFIRNYERIRRITQ